MNRVFMLLMMLSSVMASAQPFPKQDLLSQLWGYANANDQWVIPAQYQYAYSFVDGVARVTKNDLMGLIDTANRTVIPFEYNDIGTLQEGRMYAKHALTGKYGYFDGTGKKVIDFVYDGANAFYSGLAGVKQNMLWGFIDKNGTVVIPFQFDTNASYEDDWWGLGAAGTDYGYSFSGDKAVVLKNNYAGLIDKSGNVLIDFKYYTLSLVTGSSVVIAELCDAQGFNCTFGLLTTAGKTLLPFNYSYITQSGTYYKLYQGTTIDDLYGDHLGGVIGFADASGQLISPCIYDNDDEGIYANLFDGWLDSRYHSSGYREGMINVRKNGQWGYLDATGKEVIPFQFESATSFAKDSAIVMLQGATFYINKQGRCIRDCPESLSLMNAETAADQGANYNQLIDAFMKFYIDEQKNYAGDELNKRRTALYTQYAKTFDQVISYGTADQRKLAKHLKLVVATEVAWSEAVKSVEVALPYLQKVRYIADGMSASDYPITFTYQGQQRQYTYENFQYIHHSFYSNIAECEYLLGDPFAEADLKKAMLSEKNPRNKALYNGYLIDFKQKQKTYTEEILGYSNNLLESYAAMSTADRRWLDSLGMWSGNQPAAIEAAYTSNSSEKIPAGFYLRAYPLYRQAGDPANAAYFMQKLYQSGYDDYSFLWEMASMARDKSDFTLAGQVAGKLSIKTTVSDCANLQRLAEFYSSINYAGEAKEAKSKADACAKNAEKKAEQQARTDKKSSRKSSSSYGTNPGLYLGVDLFPLLSTVKGHRDYGFCVNLIGRKAAHEFYYEIINKNRDHLFDLAAKSVEVDTYGIRWDGYNAHYCLKLFMDNSSSSGYAGFCARYRSKTFEPVISSVQDVNNNLVSADQQYEPTETQYEFLLNYGFMTTKRGFACDMYFGLGPKYSVFSNHIDNYQNEDIYSHPLLENRAESRWGLGFRIGITVGLKVF